MIESKENKKIKYLKRLRIPKFMKQEEKFIVEGENLVKEAFQSGILLETYSTKEVSYGVINTVITDEVMESISSLKSTSNVIGLCKFINEDETLKDKIIILDNVQDPGNVGTIIRSSVAFGVDCVILSFNSVNKYNEKLIRASEGMVFKQNVLTKDLKYFIPYLKKNGYQVYGTDCQNGTDVTKLGKNKKVAVVMGNEGTGVSSCVKSMLDKNIYIKIRDDCESLNVAVACSIIMYELSK